MGRDVGYHRVSTLAYLVTIVLTVGVNGLHPNGRRKAMPRTPAYTPEEDAIILRTSGQPVAATNEQLVAGGFRERTADAITGRRYYLKTSNGAASDGNASIPQLLQRREALRRAVNETTEALDEVETVLARKLKAELADLDGVSG